MTVEVGRSYQRRDVTDEEWEAHEWQAIPRQQGIEMWYCVRKHRVPEPLPVIRREPHVCEFEPIPIDPARYPWPIKERCRCGRTRHIDISEEEIDARLLAMGPEEAAKWAAFMPDRHRFRPRVIRGEAGE